VRERWFGATGRKVLEITVEGDLELTGDVLVLDDVSNVSVLLSAHAAGTPVVVRASTPDQVRAALARPEVSSVAVPTAARELVELDLRELTYG
jgi:hypothetical protein